MQLVADLRRELRRLTSNPRDAALLATVAVCAVLLVAGLLFGSFTNPQDAQASGATTAGPSASSAKAKPPAGTAAGKSRGSAKPPTFGAPTRSPSGKPNRVVVVSGNRTLVDAKLIPSRLDDKGVLAPPFGVAGWYAEAGWAKPGWPGAAILAGHINRRNNGNITLDTFGKLTSVRTGDRVTVVYSSGENAAFTVTKSKALSKKAVPQDDSIWDADNPNPVLRLITCDPTTPIQGGHYKGNWVVWADPV